MRIEKAFFNVYLIFLHIGCIFGYLLIVTRQHIHFCQSIRKLMPRKCLQLQPTHSYRPETFCSNTTSLSYAVCSTMLSVRRVNQKRDLLEPHETQLSILTSSNHSIKIRQKGSSVSTGNMRHWVCGSSHHVCSRWMHPFERSDWRV